MEERESVRQTERAHLGLAAGKKLTTGCNKLFRSYTITLAQDLTFLMWSKFLN